MNKRYSLATKIANRRLVTEAWLHLKSTQRKSVDSTGCCYTGSGCAFSVALLDKKGLHDTCAKAVLEEHADQVKPWALNLDGIFSDEVQGAHDNSLDGVGFIDGFAARLYAVCKEFEVQPPSDLLKFLGRLQ